MNLGHCTVYSVLKGPLTSVISYSAQLTWRAHIWNSVENSLKLSKKNPWDYQFKRWSPRSVRVLGCLEITV